LKTHWTAPYFIEISYFVIHFSHLLTCRFQIFSLVWNWNSDNK